MSFSDRYQDSDELTISYHHPTWHEDSYWKFAKFRTLEDADEYEDLVKEIGEDRSTAQTEAFLVRYSRGWGGPDNTLPHTYKDENKQPHPLRGQVPPDTLEWIKRQEVSGDALLWLLEQYDIRTQEDEKSLPQGSGGVAPNPELPDGREEEVPVPVATA